MSSFRFKTLRKKKQMDQIALFEEKLKTRQDILAQMSEFKFAVDGLLKKDFFKALLESYSFLKELRGLDSWIKYYGIYKMEGEEGLKRCTDCDIKKMKLIEKIIFDLQQAEIFEIIEKLYKAKLKFDSIHEVENVE